MLGYDSSISCRDLLHTPSQRQQSALQVDIEEFHQKCVIPSVKRSFRRFVMHFTENIVLSQFWVSPDGFDDKPKDVFRPSSSSSTWEGVWSECSSKKIHVNQCFKVKMK